VTNNPKKMAAHESEVSLRIRTRKELGESYGNSGLAVESRSNPRDDRRFLLGDRRRVEQWCVCPFPPRHKVEKHQKWTSGQAHAEQRWDFVMPAQLPGTTTKGREEAWTKRAERSVDCRSVGGFFRAAF
jgi:hypothetical protein